MSLAFSAIIALEYEGYISSRLSVDFLFVRLFFLVFVLVVFFFIFLL